MPSAFRLPKHWNLDGGIDEIPLPEVSGRLFLTSKHVIGADVEATLGRTKADVVVCLTERHELESRYPAYVSWLDNAVLSGEAIWFPISDLHAPTVDRYEPLLDRLVALVRDGQTLAVHCAAGIGRAGTTAVAILLRLGSPLDEALLHVRKHRVGAGPEVGAQRDLVEAIARSCKPNS